MENREKGVKIVEWGTRYIGVAIRVDLTGIGDDIMKELVSSGKVNPSLIGCEVHRNAGNLLHDGILLQILSRKQAKGIVRFCIAKRCQHIV